MKTYILGTSGFLLLILGIIFIMTRPGGAARFWPGGPEAARLSRVVDGDTLVVLLCGGDKGSQDRDILKAKEYWKDYWS